MNVGYLMPAWRLGAILLLATIAWQLNVANRYLKIEADKDELSLSAVEEGIDQIHTDLEELQALLDK
jgi:hypothetical protein